MSSSFDRARFERLRAELGCGLGAPLTALAVTGSTNDDALAAARDGATHGATVVADHQTHGRGRRGRTWIAEPGDGLHFSVPLRPEPEPARLGLLPDRIRREYGFAPLPPVFVRKALVAGGAQYVRRALLPVLPDRLRLVPAARAS
jgi:hypothetical protein